MNRDSNTRDSNAGESDSGLRRWIAPGARRIKGFAIKMDNSPEQGTVRINWQSFKSSKIVQEQIKAAAGLHAAKKASATKL